MFIRMTSISRSQIYSKKHFLHVLSFLKGRFFDICCTGNFSRKLFYKLIQERKKRGKLFQHDTLITMNPLTIQQRNALQAPSHNSIIQSNVRGAVSWSDDNLHKRVSRRDYGKKPPNDWTENKSKQKREEYH